MKTSIKCQNQLVLFMTFFLLLISYIFISFKVRFHYDDYYSIVTFFLSLLLFLQGLKQFQKYGLQISNAFLMSFYFFLSLNCYGISMLQKPKTLLDIYYYFWGPLLFYIILVYFEKLSIKIKRVHTKLSFEFICNIFLFSFIGLYAYVFKTKGVRIFSNTLKSEQQSLYVIAGISGLIDVLAWTLLMLSFSINKKILKISMIICPIVFTFLNASRTLTMRMLVYMLCYVLYARGKKAANSKSIVRTILFSTVIIIGFGAWGNYREKVSGFMTISISTALQSVSGNTIFDWMYAYSAFNYDVIKQVVIEKSFPFRFKSLLRPLLRLIGGSAIIGEYNKLVSTQVQSIKGFNAATFLLYPIFELRYFYFIELFILAFIVSIVAKLSKVIGFRGGYVYFIMASIMTVYGDYYLDINGFYAIILGLIICYLIRPSVTLQEN